MSPEAPPAETSLSAAPNRQPGLIAGACAIFAGAVGFGIPILGMVASGVGIWLGIKAVRQGRRSNYTPSVACGAIGAALSALAIVFWVCVAVFESHH